jgi:hypothetical protein
MPSSRNCESHRLELMTMSDARPVAGTLVFPGEDTTDQIA